MMRVYANAKINLALHVTGQRDDGYHLIDSLVTFANISDTLEISNSESMSLEIVGLDASGLPTNHDNLILKAVRLLGEHTGQNDLAARIRLTKNLPVASGIGGGSADAAAALLALNGFWDLNLSSQELATIGLNLGADVPMCLMGEPLTACGIGEVINAVDLPKFDIVLVNQRMHVSTPEVFGRLKRKDHPSLPAVPATMNFHQCIAWLADTRNDLERPALGCCPQISNCLAALNNTGAKFARMSGSGATCFGLFADQESAIAARDSISTQYPDWWVATGRTIGAKNAD